MTTTARHSRSQTIHSTLQPFSLSISPLIHTPHLYKHSPNETAAIFILFLCHIPLTSFYPCSQAITGQVSLMKAYQPSNITINRLKHGYIGFIIKELSGFKKRRPGMIQVLKSYSNFQLSNYLLKFFLTLANHKLNFPNMGAQEQLE